MVRLGLNVTQSNGLVSYLTRRLNRVQTLRNMTHPSERVPSSLTKIVDLACRCRSRISSHFGQRVSGVLLGRERQIPSVRSLLV